MCPHIHPLTSPMDLALARHRKTVVSQPSIPDRRAALQGSPQGYQPPHAIPSSVSPRDTQAFDTHIRLALLWMSKSRCLFSLTGAALTASPTHIQIGHTHVEPEWWARTCSTHLPEESRILCRLPHTSNQPVQYSITILGWTTWHWERKGFLAERTRGETLQTAE